jgi:uncharacterized protein YegP (UPF0339 family)
MFFSLHLRDGLPVDAGGSAWVIFRYENRGDRIRIDLDAATKIFPCSEKQNFRMRFEYWKSDYDRWRWALKTSVGDMLVRVESCPSREQCMTAIRLAKLAAGAKSIEVAPRESDPVAVATFHLEPV